MKKQIWLWVVVRFAMVLAFVGEVPVRLEAAQRRWRESARVGNHSTDVVLWVVGSIVVAGIIIGAVTVFVNGKIALFK